MVAGLVRTQEVKIPFELREIAKTHCHLFEDGYSRYHVRLDPTKVVEVIEVFYDGDIFGWVFTTTQFVGSYASTGPVMRGGCDSNITDDEFETTLHLSMDFTGDSVGSFTEADIFKAQGPNANQNGEVTRQWAVERLLKALAEHASSPTVV